MRRWILVEVPGAWGRDALPQSRLGRDVGSRLLALGRDLGARVLAIRRNRYEPTPDMRVFVASTATRDAFVEELVLGTAADLLTRDLAALRDDCSVGGRPVEHPLYLVCTNGRHDRCCSVRGGPVARVLSAARPTETWECSHIGGDRFAGNLVVLPAAVYLGRVSERDAVAVVEALEAGRIPLHHYRGRAGLPFPVQAAEHALREREGLDALDAVAVLGWERTAPGRHTVRLRVADGRTVTADVATEPGLPALLTCSATGPGSAPAHRILSLELELG